MISANSTSERVFIFPRDDDQFSILATLNRAVIAFSLLMMSVSLFFLMLILFAISEKRSEEIAASTRTSGRQQSAQRTYKSMAGPKIIALNCFSMFSGSTFALSNSFFVWSKEFCDGSQRATAVFYVLSVASTYLLFEVRGRATQAKYTGMTAIFQRLVRWASIALPFTSLTSAFRSAGYIFQELHSTCLPVIDPIGSTLLMFYAGLLSAGHLFLFGLALRRHGVKIHMLPARKNRSLRTTNNGAGSSIRAPTLVMSTQQQLQQQQATPDMIRLQRIFQTNLKLALIQTSSTMFAMVCTSLINVYAPDPTTRGSNNLHYLRQLQVCICNCDLLINLAASLWMTSSWQPNRFKRIIVEHRAKVKPLLVTSGVDSSFVSSLGGGI